LENVISKEIKGKAKAEMLGTESKYLETTYLNGGKVSYVDYPADVKSDDVIILWDGSQAGTVYHGFSGALGSTFKAYTPKISGEFLFQQLKRNQDLIYEKYRTPNIPHVIKSFSKDYKIFVTKLEEQIKIGNFFKNIDDLITLHQRKFRFLINIDKI